MVATKINRRFNENSYLAILCLCGFLDLFGVSVVIPFLPKYLRGLGESYTVVGFVSSIYGFLQFFSAPIIGNLSDRFSRKNILLFCLCSTALSYLLMTASSLSASIFVIALSRIPPGLLKHSQSLTKAEIARSTKALSYFNAASTTGFIVGPPLTGMLMDHYAPSIGYSIAGQIAAAAFFLNAVDETQVTSPTKKLKLEFSWLKSFSHVTSPPLLYVFLAKFMNSQALLLQRSAYLLFLETELKLSSSTLGWLSSASSFITVAFAPLVTPVCNLFAQSSHKLQTICCLLDVISVVLLLAAPNVLFVILSAIPHGFATAVGRVNYTSITLQCSGHADEEENNKRRSNVGTLIGFDQSVLSFSRTTAPAVAGLLMDFSLRLPLVLSVFLLIPTAFLFQGLASLTEIANKNDKKEKIN